MQQMHIPKINKSDPAPPACLLNDEKRIEDGAKPGGDNKVCLSHHCLGRFRHSRDLAGCFRKLPHRCALRPGQSHDGVGHALIQQWVCQQQYVVASLKGNSMLKIFKRRKVISVCVMAGLKPGGKPVSGSVRLAALRLAWPQSPCQSARQPNLSWPALDL